MTRAASSTDSTRPARSQRTAVVIGDETDRARALGLSEEQVARLLERLGESESDTTYFPVRHHSPVCAALIERWIDLHRPAAVLVEGPSDFNEQIDELTLDHVPPIAIYSYFRGREAYYPLCEYSPEWCAVRHGRASGAEVRFIDLPWSELSEDERTHRYADAELRQGRYVRALCERLQVDDFDDLWDRIVESHRELEISQYLHRVHSLCFHIRLWADEVDPVDVRREAFMAERIREVRDGTGGNVLIVTGGFHSSALVARLEGLDCPGTDTEVSRSERPATAITTATATHSEPGPEPGPETDPELNRAGTALTPYSYEQLDSLTGYNAGMPSPGFYEIAWTHRRRGEEFTHHEALRQLVEELRRRKQVLSTADLIAVETTARALAALRGRDHVWRRDLVDAVTSSLVKDELEYGCDCPFVDAIHAVLRGQRRGRLAAETRRPPLVLDIHQQLADADLEATHRRRSVELDLLSADDLPRSRLLHRLRVLGIAGYARTGGTDFLAREDLTRLWESWEIRWSTDFEASCIQASRYGSSLRRAVTERLTEAAAGEQRDATQAAALLVQSAQAGIDTLSDELTRQLVELIARESDFVKAATALSDVVFLFCFDEALGTREARTIGDLLAQCFSRCLWLLELLGRTGDVTGHVSGMHALAEAFRRAEDAVEVAPEEFRAVLSRVEQDEHKPPPVRGAAAGILWTLGAADSERILRHLSGFIEPADLGDFLTGLFRLAREVAQRDPAVVRTIDQLLMELSADGFHVALPALRMAFTAFTPREKHHMLTTLFSSLDAATDSVSKPSRRLGALAVSASTAAEALALEERIFEAIEKYGLEEGSDE